MSITENSATQKLSKIDRNILRILQKDGRISYTDLAREVGLSVTPCIERVKRLERSGYIEGYSARLNPCSICANTPKPYIPRKLRRIPQLSNATRRHPKLLPRLRQLRLPSKSPRS
jgi:DNA-binding Lrp family transcriptional regulator